MKIGSTPQQGFTYMGLLMVLAISGIAMAGAGQVWSQAAQREREKELLYIGNQYRQAIGSYYQSTLGGAKQYPQTLEDLLLDKRFPNIKRHIRKLYQDPMRFNHQDEKLTWGLVKQQGRIVGVYSQSELVPIKTADFPDALKDFAEADTYQDWKFFASTQEDQAGIPSQTPNPNTNPVINPATNSETQ